MILFWAIAAALVVAALLFLLPPLLRRRTTAPDARVAANATIYREQLEELAADLQRGAITNEEFERASREVERRVVAEHSGSAPAPATHRPATAAALAVGLLLPLAVVIGYLQLGDRRALTAESVQQPDPKQLAALVERLSAHLKQNPQDAEGWALLARAHSSLDRHGPAMQAYSRALQLQPENRELLVELVKTLAIAGRAAFETRDYAGAIRFWEQILPFVPPESEFARTVSESILEARQHGGTSPAANAATALKGTVSLDPKLRARVSPGDTVFVLARPAEGSKMPLAVVRTTVEKLPFAFTLDDSMAMAAGATISSHAKVVIVARVSKSGNAAAQKGDVEGLSAPVAPGVSGVKVALSRVID
jgi:cytochrome c-type biogenesis protein CcmH